MEFPRKTGITYQTQTDEELVENPFHTKTYSMELRKDLIMEM